MVMPTARTNTESSSEGLAKVRSNIVSPFGMNCAMLYFSSSWPPAAGL